MRNATSPIPLLLSLGLFAACGGGGGRGANAVAPSAALSALTADRLAAPADGVTVVNLTAVVRSTTGSPLDGFTVRFDAVGIGAVVQPPQVAASGGGVAVAQLTSNQPGDVTVSATIAPDRENVRIVATLTITFTPVTAPQVRGIARFADVDGDGTASAGDTLVVPFDRDIELVGATAADFVLPVVDDTFGVGAAVTAGPGADEATITLGSGARLRTRGRFSAADTGSNASSGVGVRDTAAIRSLAEGTAASAGAAIDMAPAPVARVALPAGGVRVAVGDLTGNGVDDLLVATDSGLIPVVGDDALGLTVRPLVPTPAIADLDVGNLNRIGAAEAVTTRNDGVVVWDNNATGGSDPSLSSSSLVPFGDTRSVALIDADQDGYLDIVAGTATDVRFARHQRNLGNDYVIESTLPQGAATLDLAVGDLDGDGLPDVVAAQGANGLRLLTNVAGNLQQSVLLPFADAQRVAVGHFDGDGRLDLVATGAGAAQVFLNTASGFVRVDLATGGTVVAAVDIDGDSYDDLAFGDASGIGLLQNDRNAAFERFAGVAGAIDVVFVDLDADGDEELVGVNTAGLAVAAGSRSGTFGDTTLTPSQELGTTAVGAQELADVDGDGDLDRLVAVATGVEVWLGDGVGGFVFASEFAAAAPNAIALGDLDGDLDVDCVLAFDGPDQVFRNDGNGGFTFAIDFAPTSNTLCLALSDFDGDGDLDIVLGNEGPNQVFVVAEVGGLLTITEDTLAFSSLTPTVANRQTIALIAFDFDREGDDDLIVVNGGEVTTPQDAYLLRRAGTGYTLLSTLNAQLLATSAALGDIDGDGREDLAIAQVSAAGNATVKWFRGLATSISTLPTNIATDGQYFSRSLALADIDGDGRTDVVVGDVSVSNQPLVVLRQANDGTFATGQQVPTTRLERFAVGDFDRDGDVDVVTVETTGPSRVLANR